TINGQVAVTFAGTLDDANQNGVVGDNLIVTFQDGDTQSLESILENLSGILGSGSIMMPGTSR
ncbi:MAG TPA: hypothetical protein VF171_04980, partial [Trueperaceae bacterium]